MQQSVIHFQAEGTFGMFILLFVTAQKFLCQTIVIH